MESKSDEWTEQDLKDVITYADLASKGLSLEDNFADIYGTKYGKEVIWTIHFEIYEKEAQYSQSLKPRDVFVERRSIRMKFLMLKEELAALMHQVRF